MSPGRLPSVRSPKILLLLLAVATVLLSLYEIPIYGEGQSVFTIGTDPEFPATWTRGVPFSFSVTVEHSDGGSFQVFLIVNAECPHGHVATLSGLGTGNVCEGSIGTSPKVLGSGSVSWSFSVLYHGASESYTWTIEAHATEGMEVDIDIKPGRFPNRIELDDDDDDDPVMVAISPLPNSTRPQTWIGHPSPSAGRVIRSAWRSARGSTRT